jgi:rhodanese-related sulfurtransferase
MPRNNENEPYTRITSEEAKQIIEDEKGTVIDVRAEDEYKKGHVKGAVLIPVDQMIARINELPETNKLLFICAVGARSGLACEFAASMGISEDRLFNIDDGTPTWIEKGFPASFGNQK